MDKKNITNPYDQETQNLWKKYRKRMDPNALRLSFLNNLNYTRAKDEYSATPFDKYLSLSYVIRDRMVERWSKTQQQYYKSDAKRIYYLSLEFLLHKNYQLNSHYHHNQNYYQNHYQLYHYK